jgi:hypothetical protein
MKTSAPILAPALTLLSAAVPTLAQESIAPIARTASISAFAQGQSDVLFERRYRAFDASVMAGSASESQATAGLVAGPLGAFAFGARASLRATATTSGDGPATAFATDDLRFSVATATPFTLSAAFDAGDLVGAAGWASTVRLEVDGAGAITLADGSVVDALALRGSAFPEGTVAWGQLAAGRYRFTLEASANAAAVGGDARAALDASALLATTCRVDLSLDGVINLFDFLEFQILQFREDPRADFDGDGASTVFDLLAFVQAFEAGC